MKIRLVSSGKGAVLSGQVNADLYIDCRGIINPFRDPELRKHHGSSQVMQDWMRDKNLPYILAASTMIQVAAKSAPTRNSYKASEPLVVCFFCLAGQHRSPAMKYCTAQELQADGFEVEVV